MAKLTKLIILFSINLLIQNSYSRREKRGVTDFIIPGINIGDLAIDQAKLLIFGTPVDKDQLIIDKQLEHMKTTNEILRLSQQIATAAEHAPELTILIQSLQKMPKYFNKIDESFRQYEFYEKKNTTNSRVKQFAKQSSHPYTGPLSDVIELHSIVVPSSEDQKPLKEEDYSLLSLMSRHIKGFKKLCGTFKSEQLMLYTLLETITNAELKVFLIMEFSARKITEIDKKKGEETDYEGEIDLLRDGLEERLKKLTINFQTYMAKALREVFRCAPSHYEEGKNYFKLTLFQKYVVRDKDLTGGGHNCYKECSFYNGVQHDHCNGYRDDFDTLIDGVPRYYKYYKNSCGYVRTCTGNIYGCEEKFVEEKEVWSCPGEENSTRRYEFISEGDPDRRYRHEIFGPHSADPPKCKTGYTFDVSYPYGLSARCDVCVCTCDDSPASYADQKVSLRVATADKDYVVTGLRWVKEDHTVHLQIQQGKILPRGKINPATVKWKAVQKSRNKSDYATMSWAGLRGFLLQHIELTNRKDNVLAGVKLEIVKNKSRQLITMRLLPVAYDYATGKLNYSTPFYEDPDKSVEQGLWEEAPKDISDSDISLGRALIPSDAKEFAEPVESNKYVLLTTSDFKTDAGQNTVPYFDMQDNVLNPLAPLGGAGIYLSQVKDYGSFLALKIFSYDYSSHIVERVKRAR